MLTDYHVHLRPDDKGTDFETFFTTENAEAYRAAASERGIAELGISEHIYRFHEALDVWNHPFWCQNAADDLEEYVAFLQDETDFKVGIEADYVAGREEQMGNLLDRFEWDYVVGSVHFLRDLAVDMQGAYDVWGRGESPDKIWKRYFMTLAEAARTGQYDIMAHPDLVKIWGSAHLPEKDPRFFYEHAVEAFVETGVAVEVSTAGLRKPVGELYPGTAFLEMVVDAGCPIALSSDAHTPEHLGYGYDTALEALEAAGVTELAVFTRRERSLEAIG